MIFFNIFLLIFIKKYYIIYIENKKGVFYMMFDDFDTQIQAEEMFFDFDQEEIEDPYDYYYEYDNTSFYYDD